MISALKKLARKNEVSKSRTTMPSGVTSMGQSLQRKFGRGVQYNMKIIIKGDRNTGKSTLLGRFQGLPFKEEYLPTSEIQVCSINWNYRVADDVVKVEVWDVVDKGKKKSTSDGLKLANDLSSTEEQIPSVLDAEFLDVYKGTHGCIMMLDITKQWTFKYIERELPKIPDHIPVLVLANFLDLNEHRVVHLDEIIEFIKHLNRPKDAAIVEYGESCMKNSFGLKFIHKFFNIPFLRLQRETLEQQLQTNQEDMQATLEELSFHRNSEEQDYEQFIAYMEKKANEKKKPTSPQALGNSQKSSSSSTPNVSSTSLKSPSVPNEKAGSSKKASKSAKSIDDFVPNETIDSGFLDETDKGAGNKPANSIDSSEDSGSEDEGNPMVSGFQDISSTEEDMMEEPQSPLVQETSVNVDVDIEITSDESEEEEVVVSPVAQVPEVKDSEDELNTLVNTRPQTLKTKSDVILNEEDSSFMDAWLDSPNTNPPDLKKSAKKSRSDAKTTDLFEASQLNSNNSSKKPVNGEEDNSSGDPNEEKKKRHSEKRNKEGEEGRHKHRSKHKHKKKSKTKDSDEEESGERKTKSKKSKPKDSEDESSEKKKSRSKKKHRHKHSNSREKKETGGTGADYDSF